MQRIPSPDSTVFKIGKTEFAHLLILLLVLIAVFALNWISGGTITSPQHLAVDLASPPDSPQTWTVQNWIPTKYRVLFRWIVQATFSTFFSSTDALGFYRVFVFWSFVFFSCALTTFYYYLQFLNFNNRTALLGSVLFLLSPPVLLAYKYPVYTREDPLAYFLILVGLIALFKSRIGWMSIIATCAALTREATLILPLTYWSISKDDWRKKIWVCAPPVLAAIGIRILLGYANYNPFEGSIYNFETPWQSIAFIFCVFGIAWLPFLIHLRDKRQTRDFPNEAWRILISTAPLILILVLGTHIMLARVREIRISFLFFPWAIPLALAWFTEHRQQLELFFNRLRYRIFAFVIFAFTIGAALFVKLIFPDVMKYLADFNNGYWLVVSNLHFAVTLAIFLPFLFGHWHSQRMERDADLPSNGQTDAGF